MKLGRDQVLDRVAKKAKKGICRERVVALGESKDGVFIGISYNRPRFSHLGGGIHAEESLLYKSPRNLSKIYIARVRKGKFLPIHACPKCLKLAAKRGVTILPLVKN